jgi:hypothetical protein
MRCTSESESRIRSSVMVNASSVRFTSLRLQFRHPDRRHA